MVWFHEPFKGMKILKIPKGKSESVYQRRTDTTITSMAKRESTKEKVQKDNLRWTKHTHKTKDRVTRTPLKPGMNSGVMLCYQKPF
jgi:hypothetical protein